MSPAYGRLMQRSLSSLWRIGLAILLPVGGAAVGNEPRSGEEIYRAQCARCHGETGQGTEEFHPDPLAGDRMPLDAPDPARTPQAKARRVAAHAKAIRKARRGERRARGGEKPARRPARRK